MRGITPAYAGKTMPLLRISYCSWDHPRVCGENKAERRETGRRKGSPPRVRGKQRRLLHACFYFGITPACAGKTALNGRNSITIRDHPRVCGENCKMPVDIRVSPGSPPRVRGKLRALSPSLVCARITPACAGKTADSTYDFCVSKDHPRVCGENITSTTSSGCR